MKKNITLSLLFLSSILLFFGACTKSYDPGDWDILPDKEEPPVEVEKKTITLKLMTYVARTSGNPNRQMEDVIAHIKEYNPDLLYMRQIDQNTTRTSQTDMPKEYGEALGMGYFFAKAFDYQGGGYGNAVFSKFPIVSSKAITMLGDLDLAKTPEVRTLAMITVKIDELNELTFAGTELDPSEITSRVSQVGDVLRAVESIDNPMILSANFNDKAGSQVFDMIGNEFTFGCKTCPANSPKAAPTAILDYFTYKGADDFIVESYTPFLKSAGNILPMTAEIKMVLKE